MEEEEPLRPAAGTQPSQRSPRRTWSSSWQRVSASSSGERRARAPAAAAARAGGAGAEDLRRLDLRRRRGPRPRRRRPSAPGAAVNRIGHRRLADGRGAAQLARRPRSMGAPPRAAPGGRPPRAPPERAARRLARTAPARRRAGDRAHAAPRGGRGGCRRARRPLPRQLFSAAGSTGSGTGSTQTSATRSFKQASHQRPQRSAAGRRGNSGRAPTPRRSRARPGARPGGGPRRARSALISALLLPRLQAGDQVFELGELARPRPRPLSAR